MKESMLWRFLGVLLVCFLSMPAREASEQADEASERSFTYGRGWFCPRDGSALEPQGRTDPKCPTCGRRMPFSILRQVAFR